MKKANQIQYRNIRSSPNKLLHAFFVENFGLYGRTTVNALIQLDRKLRTNLQEAIFSQLGLTGQCQVYYFDTTKTKLHKRIWFKNGKAEKYEIMNRRQEFIKENNGEKNEV